MVFKDRFELGDYDPELKGSYILLRLFGREEITKYIEELDKRLVDDMEADAAMLVMDHIYDALKGAFEGGVVMENGKERDMTTEDIESIPLNVAKDANKLLQGSLTKKNYVR